MVEVEEEGTPRHGVLCDGVSEKGAMDDVDHTGLGKRCHDRPSKSHFDRPCAVLTLHFRSSPPVPTVLGGMRCEDRTR
jgi:hypothetical protein